MIIELIVGLIMIIISFWLWRRFIKNHHRPMAKFLIKGLEEKYKKDLISKK